MFVHVHLLLGHQVTAKAKGVRLRRVACQHCGEEYVYQLRRTAQGSAYAFLHLRTAQKRAQAQAAADQKLEGLFLQDEDEVPCPVCGHLQPHMLKTWRKRQLSYLIWGVIILVIVGAVAVGFAVLNQPPLGLQTLLAIAGICAGLMFLWALGALLRDPNRSAHRRTREALGPRCRALPAREFDALLESDPETENFTP